MERLVLAQFGVGAGSGSGSEAGVGSGADAVEAPWPHSEEWSRQCSVTLAQRAAVESRRGRCSASTGTVRAACTPHTRPGSPAASSPAAWTSTSSGGSGRGAASSRPAGTRCCSSSVDLLASAASSDTQTAARAVEFPGLAAHTGAPKKIHFIRPYYSIN